MIIYPAIDLKDGKCVRLVQGDMNQATIYNESPLFQAQEFEEAGFSWLHIVDLDGAFKGKPVNFNIVATIVRETKLKVQVGGGIRDLKTIEEYIEAGVARVILGTSAVSNLDLVKEACQRFPGKIAIGVDARGNKVAVKGWQEESNVYVFDLIAQLETIGVAAIIYTDINRDGILSGIDESGTKEIAKNINVPIIASGGVSKLEDLNRVAEMKEFGIDGVIVGRAFYEKKITYKDALKVGV